MLIHQLPDPLLFEGNSAPKTSTNVVISATTHADYHYPKHITPYLLVANFIGTGNYRINGIPTFITSQFFYFLNAGTELEINFKDDHRLETMLILFDDRSVRVAAYYQNQTDEKLLENYGLSHQTDLYIPQTPFEYNPAILHDINKLRSFHRLEEQEEILNTLLENLCMAKGTINKNLDRLSVKRRGTREELHKRLLIAKLFIHDNFCLNLTNEEIAGKACLNRFHFLKLFKAYYGVSPHHYLVKLKLDHAFAMLKTKKFSILEVCRSVGFESQSTFTNLFKRYYNVPPSRLEKTQFPNNE